MGGLDRLYRAVFYVGVGILALAVGLGVYEAWRTEQRPPRIGFSNLEEIDTLIQAGRDTEAIERLEMTLALVTRNRYAVHNTLGRVLQAGDRYPEAADHYRQAVELRPDFVEGHNNLGVVLAHAADWPPAIAAFRQAILLDPGFEPAFRNLFLAAEAYERVVAAAPDEAAGRALLAEIRGLLGGGVGGQPTHAPAAPPSAEVLRGRQGVADFHAARLDDLHRQFTPELARRMALPRLTAFQRQVVDRLGRETQLLQEQVGSAGPASYSRRARFERFDGIVEFTLVFADDGRLDDLRVRLGETGK